MDYSYSSSAADAAAASFIIVFYAVYFLILAVIVITAVVGNWKLFQKAGRQGWESIIPFYNSWVLAEITWGHGAFMFLPMIPCVGSILAIYSQYKVCAAFGKGIGFTIGYVLLYPVFHLILAFGDSQYIGVSKNFWEN